LIKKAERIKDPARIKDPERVKKAERVKDPAWIKDAARAGAEHRMLANATQSASGTERWPLRSPWYCVRPRSRGWLASTLLTSSRSGVLCEALSRRGLTRIGFVDRGGSRRDECGGGAERATGQPERDRAAA
jgi:hypothetical protein